MDGALGAEAQGPASAPAVPLPQCAQEPAGQAVTPPESPASDRTTTA